MPERRIVSVYEFEPRFLEKRINAGQTLNFFQPILDEIIEYGFNTVVLCVSEASFRNPKSMDLISNAIKDIKDAGIMCLVDPWGMGKAFGGEGHSPFHESGKLPCHCNPEFYALMTEWVDAMKMLGADGVFWDEPEHRCPDHDDISLVSEFSKYSFSKGMYNSVCFPAEYKKRLRLVEAAALPWIQDIGTDPYWPNVFTRIPREERNQYVAEWSKLVREASQMFGKSGHIWLQGFGTEKEDLMMPVEFAEVAREQGINDIAFWGYKACETLFPDEVDNPIYTTSRERWEAARDIFVEPSTVLA